jgi:hypothetical protein
MGSGAFLLEVIRNIAVRVTDDQGPGAVAPVLAASLARLIGFELQLGPFAVAQLRLLAELAEYGVPDVDPQNLRTYITNTLDDPFVEETQLGTWYKPITDARRAANRVKAEERVLVVLGNPPYKDRSRGAGGWIEQGAEGDGVPLERFMPEAQWNVGAHVRHLYNAYVYFWRWATWKVFDSAPIPSRGVVCFITVSGFLNGPGFEGMRRYLRQTCDDIWVIDCSPEGFRPPVNKRVFEAMKHEVCITVAARSGGGDPDTPARVHYRQLRPADRTDKFTQLQDIHLGDSRWQPCSSRWRDPFLPEATGDWASYLALDDVFLYDGTGIMAGRSWIMDPDPDILTARWDALTAEPDRERKKVLFMEHTPDRTIDKVLRDGLPGFPVRSQTIASETGPCPSPVPVAFRSFDRRWIIPDKRLINRPNPTLWSGRSDHQVWLTAPARESPVDGPALTGCALIPDVHHYNGRGGRAYPLWQNAGATVANINSALLAHLSTAYRRQVTAPQAVAYVAGICAHPGYTSRFAVNFKTPGLRVPWTKDPNLFTTVSDLGAQVLWLHTSGQAYADSNHQRPKAPPRMPHGQRPQVPAGATIPSTPDQIPESKFHDPDAEVLHIGDGMIINVSTPMWEYRVSGTQVVRDWFNDRRRDRSPTLIGDRTISPLWQVHSDYWRASYTTELLDLLNVLGRLVLTEPDQDAALSAVVAGEIWSVEELTAAGVLPITRAQRALRADLGADQSEGLFNLDP